MSLFRRPAKRTGGFGSEFERILVPVIGDPAIDGPALSVAALLLAERAEAEAALLHVLEVPFERNLDAEDEAGVTGAEEILGRAEGLLRERGIRVRSSTVQARAAGPAIVDEANEGSADLIVMGLRYKKRFGGQWDAGRTVPYVMRNSTAPVWCLRAETKELAHTP